MDDRDFDPPESPESRAEYINRYIRHFHACILIIALGTLVGYFACSLELLEQHEAHLSQQLQHVRDVREQQTQVLCAISSISRNLTGWAGIDTGLLATMGPTDSTSNAWSGDGLIPTVDGAMAEIPISVSSVHNWEEELRQSDITTPDSPPQDGHGDVNTTVETRSATASSVADRDHTARAGSSNRWHTSPEPEEDGTGDDDDDGELTWAERADDDEDGTDYYADTELGAAEASPQARSAPTPPGQSDSEDATLERRGTASSSSRPHHGPQHSMRPDAKARPIRKFVGKRRDERRETDGPTASSATPSHEPTVEDSSVAPWKRGRTI